MILEIHRSISEYSKISWNGFSYEKNVYTKTVQYKKMSQVVLTSFSFTQWWRILQGQFGSFKSDHAFSYSHFELVSIRIQWPTTLYHFFQLGTMNFGGGISFISVDALYLISFRANRCSEDQFQFWWMDW